MRGLHNDRFVTIVHQCAINPTLWYMFLILDFLNKFIVIDIVEKVMSGATLLFFSFSSSIGSLVFEA